MLCLLNINLNGCNYTTWKETTDLRLHTTMPRLGTVPLLLLFAYLVGRVTSMTPREEPSSDSGDGSKRTLFSIIWGCVSTTIICAWSATHPNIPPREETFKATIRRLELMGLALMAPEVLPAFALNQLFATVKIRNEYNKARGRSLPVNVFDK